MLNDAIFPGSIHCLKDEEQCVVILGVELVLQIGELRNSILEEFLAFLLAVHAPAVPGIVIFQAKVFAVIDLKRFDKVLRLLH
jgi:hypothetical protein